MRRRSAALTTGDLVQCSRSFSNHQQDIAFELPPPHDRRPTKVSTQYLLRERILDLRLDGAL